MRFHGIDEKIDTKDLDVVFKRVFHESPIFVGGIFVGGPGEIRGGGFFTRQDETLPASLNDCTRLMRYAGWWPRRNVSRIDGDANAKDARLFIIWDARMR